MRGRGLLWKYALFNFFGALAIFVLGAKLFDYLTRESRLGFRGEAAIFLGRLIEDKGPGDNLDWINAARKDLIGYQFNAWIVDKTGRISAQTASAPPPINWSSIQLPSQEHEYLENASSGILKLRGEPDRYLVVSRDSSAMSPIRKYGVHFVLFFIILAVFYVILSVLFLFVYLRAKAREAKGILSRMERGELNARFPKTRMDELGQLMGQFNTMADEIQRLVESLRAKERIRVELLEELGHDLRTPLMSMRNVIDTLILKSHRLDDQTKAECLRSLEQELSYMTRLLEDLFLIAKMNEPKYRPEAEPIDLCQLLKAEIEQVNGLVSDRIKVTLQTDASPSHPFVLGDSNLLERLFRNGLNNAQRYAKHAITLSIKGDSKTWEISLRDDGPGFSEDALSKFGKRLNHRVLEDVANPAISLGLGSFIMKSIAELHGGNINAGNWNKPDGSVGGGEVRVWFKATQGASSAELGRKASSLI